MTQQAPKLRTGAALSKVGYLCSAQLCNASLLDSALSHTAGIFLLHCQHYIERRTNEFRKSALAAAFPRMPGNEAADGDISPPASQHGSVDAAGSDISTEMMKQMGGLVGGNLVGMGGIPGYILLNFPKIMAKMARYPRLAKVLSFALTLALASYLNFSMVSTALTTTWTYFISLFTSSVTISGQDPIVDEVQTWLRKVPMFLPSHALRGESSYFIKKRDADNDYDDWDYDDEGQRVQKDDQEPAFKMLLHRSNQVQLFRHQGRFFIVKKDGADNLYKPSDVSSMTFFCFGWSPKPITSLLADIDKCQKTVQEERWTTIRTHEDHGYGNWSRPQTKLARPITSVDLDQGQRDMIVNDLAEYLDPATKQWYHRLGIPYRRGYMFYGPPGTGKSSLAMALAGHFKLDIHVLSLLDKNMNDHSLNRLMKSMGGKPLVLLEDIDSAGIGRDFDDEDSDDESEDGWRHKQKKSNVTLSGLLNAIDGVGAPEGHVLIMSTNHIEKMEEALVRAGRVDIKVKLDWCSHSQTRDIFLRMYSQTYKRRAASTEGQHTFSQAALEEMAGKFAEQVPELQISPAELQDFILMRKSNPTKALEDIGEWAAAMIQERKEAEEEAEKKKKNKKKKKDADGDSTDGESDNGGRTPPPSFEEVTASKSSWVRWLKKIVMVEYSS